LETKSSGFTLLELLTVVVIIAILGTLTFPIVSAMRARAQRAQCTANLHALYVAANLFVQQNNSWPQIRLTSGESASTDFANAWIAALEPFGPTRKTWICPSFQEYLQNPDYNQSKNTRIDYMPMPFDDKPMTPHQWPQQPWFIENVDIHGNGHLIIFTDGSISDSKTIAQNASPQPK
jgi:prepilin-type N-terminal cleavage/methylation domain-containing protein